MLPHSPVAWMTFASSTDVRQEQQSHTRDVPDEQRVSRSMDSRMGAWLSYGLGTENENLPAFVVLPDPRGTSRRRIHQLDFPILPPITKGSRFAPTPGSPWWI